MKLKILFLPIALVLSLSIAIWFVNPEWKAYGEEKVELEALNAKKAELDDGLRALNRSMDAYDMMDESSKQLVFNAIPKKANNDDFVAEIHNNARKSGVLISGIKMTDPIKKKPSSKNDAEKEEKFSMMVEGTVAEVKIVGNYLDVKAFVKMVDMENRMSLPLKTIISEVEEATVTEIEGEGEIDVSQLNLVKANVVFGILHANQSYFGDIENINDETAKQLLSIGLDEQVIENYKKTVTSTLFKPVIAPGADREDLFAKKE